MDRVRCCQRCGHKHAFHRRRKKDKVKYKNSYAVEVKCSCCHAGNFVSSVMGLSKAARLKMSELDKSLSMIKGD